MTPEGICSREPRCRFDDCYFVIKVNRNKNELVTKQLIYSSAWPRRGSLGKAGQWCSHSWEEQAAPQKCPQPEPDGAAFPGFHPLSLLLCASQIPPRPFCTVLPKQNSSVSGLKPNILSKMFQCCLCLYTAVGVGAGWSWDPALGSRQSWDPTLGSAVEMELPAPGMQPEWEQEKRAEHGKKGQPLL